MIFLFTLGTLFPTFLTSYYYIQLLVSFTMFHTVPTGLLSWTATSSKSSPPPAVASCPTAGKAKGCKK